MQEYQRLEVELANWLGYPAENVAVCASGTSALHLSLEVLRIPTGSAIIVPNLSMIACARAVTLANLSPTFVDCTDTLLLDASLLPPTEDIKAVMVVHIYGRRCDMESVHAWAAPRNAFVIEDMAEAHGVSPHKDTYAACYSFFKNKIVAGEEGGAVAFRSPIHATLARSLRSLGFTDAHDFYHIPRGHNYRLSNLHAVPIRESLRRVAPNIAVRREIEGWYDTECPPQWRMPPRDAVWVYDLRIPHMLGAVQDTLIRDLQSAGIAARHCFKPMREQEEYKGHRHIPSSYSENISGRLSREIIYLPVQPGITTRESVKLAFQVIRSVVGLPG